MKIRKSQFCLILVTNVINDVVMSKKKIFPRCARQNDKQQCGPPGAQGCDKDNTMNRILTGHLLNLRRGGPFFRLEKNKG